MNLIFAKTALYAYTNLAAIAEQIDELVEKKALSSMTDFSPAFSQCLKIADLTRNKQALYNLRFSCEKILSSFCKDDLDILDYKYFRLLPRDYFADKDTSSRKYFRRQVRLSKNFAEKLEKAGYTEKVIEEEYLSIEFFKELYKRVTEYEKSCFKNKKKGATLKEKMFSLKTSKDLASSKIRLSPLNNAASRMESRRTESA